MHWTSIGARDASARPSGETILGGGRERARKRLALLHGRPGRGDASRVSRPLGPSGVSCRPVPPDLARQGAEFAGPVHADWSILPFCSAIERRTRPRPRRAPAARTSRSPRRRRDRSRVGSRVRQGTRGAAARMARPGPRAKGGSAPRRAGSARARRSRPGSVLQRCRSARGGWFAPRRQPARRRDRRLGGLRGPDGETGTGSDRLAAANPQWRCIQGMGVAMRAVARSNSAGSRSSTPHARQPSRSSSRRVARCVATRASRRHRRTGYPRWTVRSRPCRSGRRRSPRSRRPRRTRRRRRPRARLRARRRARSWVR